MIDRKNRALQFLYNINDNRKPPANITEKLDAFSKMEDIVPPLTMEDLAEWLTDPADSQIRSALGLILNKWDYTNGQPWVSDSEPNTKERRALIYNLLSLSKSEANLLDELFPPYPRTVDNAIRILAENTNGQNEYDTFGSELTRPFYWRSYERYLRERKRWSSKNVATLHDNCAEIVSYLEKPTKIDARAKRGLVVGYVQSGKTASFTGVIAKAIDRGYRLVIVLGGTQNTLRDQTQRRLDKELVGAEDPGVQEEYGNDDDWSDFNSHGGLPVELGYTQIYRLTTSKTDFSRTPAIAGALLPQKRDPSKPACVIENLQGMPCILIVIKKNKTTLTHLLETLVAAGKSGTKLDEVPSLVIDDESDQASLNTRRDQTTRSEINRLIVEILKKLQRAQYIGYTATPFANVFVDPEDSEDIFPADFIVSLPRPEGYMGVRSFYDFVNGVPQISADHDKPYGAHIRPVTGDDEDPANLQRAIDAFVLSGAIKLFREASSQVGLTFRHHTMLVHTETRMKSHVALADRVAELFLDAGYSTNGSGIARLEDLWNKDFFPVMKANVTGDLPDFKRILPFIGKCVQRIHKYSDRPCKVLNSASDDIPDFDKTAVWQIIVGGAKLSRGFTVEGLTISYYRRVARAADTLMQMGRWFGYREHYTDLVRLFIGTEEPLDKNGKRKINLYEAFGALCLDEEDFRSELEKYSKLAGEERLTPRNVPPLVPSHMLPPTSKNKMYNSEITFMNFGGEIKNPTFLPTMPDLVRSNFELWRKLNAVTEPRLCTFEDKAIRGRYLISMQTNETVLAFLKEFRQFNDPLRVSAEWRRYISFVSGTYGDPNIREWCLIHPLVAESGRQRTSLAEWEIPHVSRDRDEGVEDVSERIKTIIDPKHRELAKIAAGLADLPGKEQPPKNWRIDRAQAVLVIYLIEEKSFENPQIGLSLIFPKNEIKQKIRYRAIRNDDNRIIVPYQSDLATA